MFQDSNEQPEVEPVEEEVVEKAVVEETIDEAIIVEEPKPKRSRSSKKKKKEDKVIPLASIDRHLQPKEEKPELSGRVPLIPDKEVKFPEGTEIVGAALVKKMLRDTSFRRQGISERVAYLGRGTKQKWFGLELTSWRVAKGGILYVPEVLAGFTLLKSWERVEEDAPDGFVAFRAQ